MLVIGLQEKPALFLPVEYRIGGEMEPIGIRYSLGWTVVGPVGGQKDNEVCSTNFVRTLDNSYITKQTEKSLLAKSVECINRIDQQSVNLASERNSDPIMGQEMSNLRVHGRLKSNANVRMMISIGSLKAYGKRTLTVRSLIARYVIRWKTERR